MSIFTRLFGKSVPDPKDRLQPLYKNVIAKGRELHWYEAGQVPDTMDGRFGIISSILALVLLRMEQISGAAQDAAYLTELFIDDMDAQMREAGLGDVVVAKDMGKVMSVLGGRIGAFRGAFDDAPMLAAAIERNIFGGVKIEPSAASHMAVEFTAYWRELQAADHAALISAHSAFGIQTA
jgi:cytochrome b pre-mRNA-processing protein 3